MLQSDLSQWPMGVSHSILPPHFIGGVARSRHAVALGDRGERPAARRLWSILSRVRIAWSALLRNRSMAASSSTSREAL
jgi:hypothetical protein